MALTINIRDDRDRLLAFTSCNAVDLQTLAGVLLEHVRRASESGEANTPAGYGRLAWLQHIAQILNETAMVVEAGHVGWGER